MNPHTHALPTAGQRIRIIEMPNDPDPVPADTLGTVVEVTQHDPPRPTSISQWERGRPVKTQLPGPDIEATIEVRWDNGRSLNVLYPADRFEIVGHEGIPADLIWERRIGTQGEHVTYTNSETP
jgi:hypothetical protein